MGRGDVRIGSATVIRNRPRTLSRRDAREFGRSWEPFWFLPEREVAEFVVGRGATDHVVVQGLKKDLYSPVGVVLRHEQALVGSGLDAEEARQARRANARNQQPAFSDR